MFNPGDYVVYGYSGVCKVEEITAKEVPGTKETRAYYALQPIQSASNRVFTPVDGKQILRAVMTKDEAESFLDEICNIEPLEIISDKHRENQYKEVMRTCDYREWVKLIKTLYARKAERLKKGKQATAVDNRYTRSAEEYLFTELSIALSKDFEEIEKFITDVLTIV